MDRTSMLAAWSLTALALCSPPAAAQGAGKPDLAKAKQTAETVCAACHGADGNSAVSVNPNLAGQGAEYISRQLQHFKAGIRVNPVMQGMVAALTPEDMTALGIYFSQQKPKNLAAKDPKLVAMAQTLYRAGDAATGLPACAACHSPNGAGIPKNYPATVRPVRRLHVCAIEGVQGRRARQRPGRQGRARQDHVGGRAAHDRRADEGAGGLRLGITVNVRKFREESRSRDFRPNESARKASGGRRGFA